MFGRVDEFSLTRNSSLPSGKQSCQSPVGSFQRAFLQWRNCENSSDMRIILSGTDENDSVSVKGEETNPRTASTRNALTHFPAEIYEVLRWSKLDPNRKTARHAKAKDPSISLKSSSTLTPFDSLKEEVMISVSFTSQQVQLERLFRSVVPRRCSLFDDVLQIADIDVF